MLEDTTVRSTILDDGHELTKACVGDLGARELEPAQAMQAHCRRTRIGVACVVCQVIERHVGDRRACKTQPLHRRERQQRGHSRVAQADEAREVERCERDAAPEARSTDVANIGPRHVEGCQLRQTTRKRHPVVTHEPAAGQAHRAQRRHGADSTERCVRDPFGRVGEIERLDPPACAHEWEHVRTGGSVLLSLERSAHLLPHQLRELRGKPLEWWS
mmetsp:Transcript_27854/g.71113  ORF Transcript_27854/g.71113 Transcript_27854/m.71113 type:complete len:217 (-) Transcript_27854:411-1061(-)